VSSLAVFGPFLCSLGMLRKRTYSGMTSGYHGAGYVANDVLSSVAINAANLAQRSIMDYFGTPALELPRPVARPSLFYRSAFWRRPYHPYPYRRRRVYRSRRYRR